MSTRIVSVGVIVCNKDEEPLEGAKIVITTEGETTTGSTDEGGKVTLKAREGDAIIDIMKDGIHKSEDWDISGDDTEAKITFAEEEKPKDENPPKETPTEDDKKDKKRFFYGNRGLIVIGTMAALVFGVVALLMLGTFMGLQRQQQPTTEPANQVEVAPPMPEVTPRDSGSYVIKTAAQWLFPGLLVAGAVLVLADTGQTIYHAKEDSERGSLHGAKPGFRIVSAIFALPLTVLMVILVAYSDKPWIRDNLILFVGEEAKMKMALFEVGILLALIYFASFGNLSLPVWGLTSALLITTMQQDKGGLITEMFNIPGNAQIYAINDVFALISAGRSQDAKFSLVLFSLLFLFLVLIWVEMVTTGEERWIGVAHVFGSILIGLAYPVAGYYGGPWAAMATTLLLGLIASFLDRDRFDETTMAGLVVGTIAQLMLPIG